MEKNDAKINVDNERCECTLNRASAAAAASDQRGGRSVGRLNGLSVGLDRIAVGGSRDSGVGAGHDGVRGTITLVVVVVVAETQAESVLTFFSTGWRRRKSGELKRKEESRVWTQ